MYGFLWCSHVFGKGANQFLIEYMWHSTTLFWIPILAKQVVSCSDFWQRDECSRKLKHWVNLTAIWLTSDLERNYSSLFSSSVSQPDGWHYWAKVFWLNLAWPWIPVDVGQPFFNKFGLFGWFVNDTMSPKPGFYFSIICC